MKRSRADNVSAIVVFLDDEFSDVISDDSDSVTSLADTVIVTNEEEDDTPPMSACDGEMNSLVRQLALPYSGSSSKSPGHTLDKRNIEDTTPPSDEKNKSLELCTSKRKIIAENESSVPPYKLRKVRPISPVSPVACSEESHQCNVITVLSTESLYGLQLDENLDDVDDNEPAAGDEDSSLDGIMSAGQNMDEHLKFMPVPQATK